MYLPLETYRVQLSAQFSFADLTRRIPYLKELGIRDIYLSPILQAQPKSTHGYDMTDYRQINLELGGIGDFKKLCAVLKKHGLGVCVDIVPNHMAATEHNVSWREVLKNGKKSALSYLFDIKWNYSTANKLRYRRFFDINELVCLRAEDERVFHDTHRLILQLIKDDLIQGLRIDHIDGLRDPLNYLKNLTKAIKKPFYIIAEKILGFNEALNTSWPLAGTTGYDFLNQLNQLFISSEGLSKLVNFYNQAIDNDCTVEQIKKKSLKRIINTLFKNEFDVLCGELKKIFPDEQFEEISSLLLQFSSAMPVYRFYNDPSSLHSNEQIIYQIKNEVKITNKKLLDVFCDLLSGRYPAQFETKQKQLWEVWRSDWEVFTGPVMAKGFEDTTCYNYNALLSINEVGSAPQYYECAGNLAKFHEYNAGKQEKWPYSLNATSTHDTKRSEDVRARLNVLSELSEEWNAHLKHWQMLNRDKKWHTDQHFYPDANDELMLYQVMIGAWPIDNNLNHFKVRIKNFLMKAMRERKVHSTWMKPNKVYEEATYSFFYSILNDEQFLDDFVIFQEKVAFYGMYNSLSQTLLKITCPGIPDFYQGSERWCFDLVDPDNRHLINYDALNNLKSDKPLNELLKSWQDSRIKFNLIKKLLSIRHEYKKFFLEGAYTPLKVEGENKEHVIAFMKYHDNEWIIVITLRWFTSLISLNSVWHSSAFTAESIHVPGSCFSLIDRQKITLKNNSLLIKDAFDFCPFNILKNSE